MHGGRAGSSERRGRQASGRSRNLLGGFGAIPNLPERIDGGVVRLIREVWRYRSIVRMLPCPSRSLTT